VKVIGAIRSERTNAIGGARSVIVTRTSGNGFEFVNVAAGLFEFNLGAGDSGSAQIIWDGDTNPALNENGFGPVDLTGGGTNTALIAFVRSDLIAPITFTVYSGAGNYSTFTIGTPGNGFAVPFAEYYMLFGGFVSGGGTGADFTAVTAIAAFVDGTSQPGAACQLDLLGTNRVPEPGTFGLAGLMLGSLLVFARRK